MVIYREDTSLPVVKIVSTKNPDTFMIINEVSFRPGIDVLWEDRLKALEQAERDKAEKAEKELAEKAEKEKAAAEAEKEKAAAEAEKEKAAAEAAKVSAKQKAQPKEQPAAVQVDSQGINDQKQAEA